MKKIASAVCAVLWTAAALAILASHPGSAPVAASEAIGDLNLDLRVVNVSPGPATGGAGTQGVATLDAVLGAYRGARDLRLRILKPDGTAWTFQAKPLEIGAVRWKTPEGGEPLEADGTPSIASGGTLVTRLAVPLDGAAIHEIVVEVTATVAGQTVRTENMVRVALGVAMPAPVVGEDGVASFPMGVQR